MIILRLTSESKKRRYFVGAVQKNDKGAGFLHTRTR